MALKTLTAEHTDAILEILFPRTEHQKKRGLKPERWGRIKHVLDDDAVTPSKTKNALWALYNAMTRNEDYRSSRSASGEVRLQRVWFDSGHDLKIRALTVCRDQLRKAA